MEVNIIKRNITVILGVILVIVIIGMVVLNILLYMNNSKYNDKVTKMEDKVLTLETHIMENDTKISTLSDQVIAANTQISTLVIKSAEDLTTLRNGLSSVNDQIDSLSNQLADINTRLTSLQNSVSSDRDDIAAIQNQLTTINSRLNSAESSLDSLQDTMTPLQDTTNSLQSSLTSLQNTIDSLITQVNGLSAAANNPVPLITTQAISQSFSTQTTVFTYTPGRNGYFYVNGTSTSATGYIRIANNSLGTYTDYTFGTGTALTATVTAGYSYSIIFGNHDSSGTVNALLSATYYPGTSSTSNSTTLFTSQTISQSQGTQTLVYSIVPSSSGYIQISGTSNSALAYIRLSNTSTGTYTDYNFGTGTTLNMVVTAGYTYWIVLGNTASSGFITATLTGIYYY